MAESIEISLGEIEKCVKGINSIKDIPVPAKTGYWIGNLENKLESVIKNIAKGKDSILKKHGTVLVKDGKEIPGNYNLAPENISAYNEDINNFLEEKETIEFIKMKFELFIDKDGKELNLPQIFWSSVGKFFINAPEE